MNEGFEERTIDEATGEVSVTEEQLDLVRRTVAVGATEDELRLYLYDCNRQRVHPLDKLLHFTKRGGKYTPITSIDLMRTRAADTGEYAGSDDAIFNGATGTQTFSATVTIWRIVKNMRVSFTASARWSEYCPSKGQDYMWTKMPHTMLAKCAEALALRKGFPRQLAGLYAKEEMDQANIITTVPAATKHNLAPSPQHEIEPEDESQDPSELDRLLDQIAGMSEAELRTLTGTGEVWKSRQREWIGQFGNAGLKMIKERLTLRSVLLKAATPATPSPASEDRNEPAERLKEALGETSPFEFISLEEAERQIFATDDPELIHSVRQRVAKHLDKYDRKALVKANKFFDEQEKSIREAKGETAE